jgi:hypothetical protein
LIQTENGKGAINILRPNLSVETIVEAPKPGAPQPAPAPADPAPIFTTPKTDPLTLPAASSPTSTPAQQNLNIPRPSFAATTQTPKPTQPPTTSPSPLISKKDEAPEVKELVRAVNPETTQKIFKVLANTIKAARSGSRKVSDGFGSFLPRLLPESTGVKSAPWMMNALLIAIPLILFAIAAVVYTQVGKTKQFESYYDKAWNAALQTVGKSDPNEVKRAWTESLHWLDEAERYGTSENAVKLREQAQKNIDAIDGIARLDYQKALNTPLSAGVIITQMAANDTDVFMLNAVRGNVYRAYLTGRGYDVDTDFKCEPGVYGDIQVGPLVDIVSLPRTNQISGTMIGVDANGIAIYCTGGQEPRVITLVPPDTGWNKITSITFDNGYLYVLDAPANAVWTYFMFDGVFSERPSFFFSEEVPNMNSAVDLAVTGDDLYLLNQDGHLVTCTLSRLDVSPTRCVNPAILNDTRAGYRSGPVLADAVFSQIAMSAAPDIAVAFLEPFTQAIYRFSPRSLDLQNQLRSQPGKSNQLPSGTVNAMALAPNHIIFLFINGELYYAQDTP